MSDLRSNLEGDMLEQRGTDTIVTHPNRGFL